MRVVADAHRLPLAPASVDLVIGNPPYPGNGYWPGDWPAGIDAAMTECRRVMRPAATGWFLLPHHGENRWLYFDHVDARWGHTGSWSWPLPLDSARRWGVIPDAEVAPLILQWSLPGDVVLDPFAGRGGIPRLAARLGRVPVGADIDAAQLENGGSYA